VGGEVRDFANLVAAYAKQETVDPIRALGRFFIWGMISAVLVSVGAILVDLAIVRALQTELHTHLKGSLTWLPYIGGILFAAGVVALAAWRIPKVPR
jgi:hypothetical protein